MTISSKVFAEHRDWCLSNLKGYQQYWFNGLYRHEPIENVIEILKSRKLLSRSDALDQSAIKNDIAPERIISKNLIAHPKVRLYFRPRNPTQYHVEGIRRANDYYYGKHAGLTILLVFDAEKILTSPDATFSGGNLQSLSYRELRGDKEFKQLDFRNIYHDGPHYDHNITQQKCAEVLVPNPLKI